MSQSVNGDVRGSGGGGGEVEDCVRRGQLRGEVRGRQVNWTSGMGSGHGVCFSCESSDTSYGDQSRGQPLQGVVCGSYPYGPSHLYLFP